MQDGGTAPDEDGPLVGPGYDRVDATVFRDTLARVPTPVTVVTSHIDRKPHGTTVSAFSSLSLEPPMILVSLDQNSDLLKIIQESGRFGVNVLASGQQSLATTLRQEGRGQVRRRRLVHGPRRPTARGQGPVAGMPHRPACHRGRPRDHHRPGRPRRHALVRAAPVPPARLRYRHPHARLAPPDVPNDPRQEAE